MTDTGGATTTTTTQRKGRTLAWISRVDTRERGFIFAVSADDVAEEVFLHCSATPPAIWDHLDCGDVVSCRIADTTKGPRGYDVQHVIDETIVNAVKRQEEDYGNR